MRLRWPLALSLSIFTSSAFAVDGAGLRFEDILVVIALLLGATAPLLAIAGAAFLLVKLVQRIVRGPREPDEASIAVLPPASGDIQFTDEEANLMQRWNIFFNGKQYRVRDLKFDTLAAALTAATSTSGMNNEP